MLSHPQATAQCARLPGRAAPARRAHRGHVHRRGGAAACASRIEPWAALGSRLAAELYGADVLAEGVEDRADNLTRFVWLARAGEAPEAHGPESKTSIVFWGFNDESPGALVSVLRELSDRQINLTRIESRPRRVRLGHYMFFADLERARTEGVMDEALRGARRARGDAARAGLLRRRRTPRDRLTTGRGRRLHWRHRGGHFAGTTGRGGLGARAGSSGRAAGTPAR